MRFPDGKSPVFALGDRHVVELLPAFSRDYAQREINLLRHMEAQVYSPAPRPVAHAGWPARGSNFNPKRTGPPDSISAPASGSGI